MSKLRWIWRPYNSIHLHQGRGPINRSNFRLNKFLMEVFKRVFLEECANFVGEHWWWNQNFPIFLYLVMDFRRWCHRCSLNRSRCGVHLRVGLKDRIFFMRRLALCTVYGPSNLYLIVWRNSKWKVIMACYGHIRTSICITNLVCPHFFARTTYV